MRLETLLSVGGSRRTMTSPYLARLLLFSLFMSCGRFAVVSACKQEPETPDWRMTLKTIRNGIHKIDTYLNAALDLFGGDDGLCHYKCSDGGFFLHNICPFLSNTSIFVTCHRC